MATRTLYLDAPGSFDAMPLMVRAIAAYLVKLTDDDGFIYLSGRDPVKAIAYQAGANRSDRRMLAKAVPVLIAVGYLVVERDRMLVRGARPGFVASNISLARSAVRDEPTERERHVRREASALREVVIRRDGHICQLCRCPVDPGDIHIDHIVAVSRGGESSLENLQVTHSRCNLRKGAS